MPNEHDTLARQRPTSPHLSIYRPQISSMLSITHRITGVALHVGLLLLALWLWSAAYAPDFFTYMHNCLASLVGQCFLLGWTLAFYYHLGNGVRHLVWDTGHGLTLPAMNRSGWAVIIFTLAMTALTWGMVHAGAV